ncbi:MAG TPA: uroporphyrinogen-III synthase [Rhodopila sp.]|nr:uroporphyrinogen-III synthase [Rhodopila sp.]
MIHVLITRTEPDATETACRIQALGLVPLVAPIFELQLNPDQLAVANSIAAAVLTSRHAVAACPSTLHTRPAFAVGPATATRATAAGFRNVVNADGDADAVVECIRTQLQPAIGSILLPTTTGQGGHLATRLRSLGFRVIRRVAYRVVPKPTLPEIAAENLRSARIASALFFSTESARHFVRLVIAAGLAATVGNVEAVSISQRPVVALERLPWRRISVASKPNQDAMLALLK